MEFQGERHDLANIPFYFDVRTPKVGDRTGFTRREKEVIELILEDRSNKEIAKQLSISERTTKFHVSEILLKLKVRKRAEIIKMLRPDGDTR